MLSCAQDGVLGGINDEFVFAGRLDNLAMSYVALQVRHGSRRTAALQMPYTACFALR